MATKSRSYQKKWLSRFAVLGLLTWFHLPAQAAEDWVERLNQQPDPARPLGWRFEVPSPWRQGSLANYPYPLGESWNGSDGGFQVCWLGQTASLGQEQLNLESRGFSRAERRVAGRDAVLFQRQQEAFCYVKSPKGVCRLHLNGSNPIQDHILKSFTLVETAQSATGSSQTFADWNFELPPGWQWQAPDTIVSEGQPVCKLVSYSLERDQMLRGWARNQACSENPKLKERVEMEPFTSKRGVDGYLVEWKGPSGPLLYAYSALKQKGLRLELLKPGELDRLRRMVNSLQFRG